MSDEALLQRVQALETDNARLRRLLERGGSTAGQRHQIRNTLAMVRNIVRHTAERLEDADDYLAHLEGRLDAVFRIHNTIANGLFDGVDLAMLVTDELLAQAVSEGNRLSVEGPGVLLQPAAAAAVALAVHELAVNAIKFGALSAQGGQIAVSWTAGEGRDRGCWLTLRWVESGVAAASASHAAHGFGTETVENAMRYGLGGEGTLDFGPDGLRCTIRLPLMPWIGQLRGMDESGDDA